MTVADKAVPPPPPPSTEAQRRRIIAACHRIGLTHEERYELALAILGVQITSFDELWESGANRLLAGMVGWSVIAGLLRREAGCPGIEELGPRVGLRTPEWASQQRSSRQLRKIMGMCREVDFDRDQRHEFASAVLGRPVGSFAELDALSACWLIDALNGYHAVEWLARHARPVAVRPAVA